MRFFIEEILNVIYDGTVSTDRTAPNEMKMVCEKNEQKITENNKTLLERKIKENDRQQKALNQMKKNGPRGYQRNDFSLLSPQL